MPGEFIGLVAVVMVFGIPLAAIYSEHKRKLAEMRLRLGSQSDERTLAALNDLRQQITELRDTTTRYDLSFDAALQRLESRVGNLERRVTAVEQGSSVGVRE